MFTERAGYQIRRNRILGCRDYGCILLTEKDCLRWCDNLKKEQSKNTCRGFCLNHAKKMVDYSHSQWQRFGDAYYYFTGFTNIIKPTMIYKKVIKR